jgi:hypothetical protein
MSWIRFCMSLAALPRYTLGNPNPVLVDLSSRLAAIALSACLVESYCAEKVLRRGRYSNL